MGLKIIYNPKSICSNLVTFINSNFTRNQIILYKNKDIRYINLIKEVPSSTKEVLS